MKKCFLNPKKIGADPSFSFLEKNAKTHALNPKNDVTESKVRLHSNQLNC